MISNKLSRFTDENMNMQLLTQMQDAIKNTITDKKIGVAFSGGVDSTLLAKLVKDLEYDVHLLTIGFHDSHDINFAKEVNEILNFPHSISEIDPEKFKEVSDKIHQLIKTDNLSWNENSIAFYYVAELAQKNGLNTVVTANGIDELFCGYNSYREAIETGEDEVVKMMNDKLKNEEEMMVAVNAVTAEFGVRMIQPFLSPSFVDYAKKIPISEKIHGPDDMKRKHAIRELAMDYGVPEVAAQKQKKALQYGSQIHKSLLKSRKTSAFTWLLTLSIIVSDAPRWFCATKIDFISLSERADETTLSFPSASIKLIPFLCAANATLCTSLYALNRGMPFLISASNTNSEKICPFVM
jgi:asparagine synthase (glutamine-hydrolysing)